MKYLGGKSATCERIASYINSLGDAPKIIPFCGSCNVTQHLKGRRYASDIHYELIALWGALQRGWNPPSIITPDQYREAKEGYYEGKPITPEMAGFIGFGCSFSGKWWGGYARVAKGDDSRGYARESRDGLLRKIGRMKDVMFKCYEYAVLRMVRYKYIIYCDPPYENTTGYKTEFDSNRFWNIVRVWSQYNIVIISEYQAPPDFRCILEMPVKLMVRSKQGNEQRIERLFVHNTLKVPDPIRQESLEI